MAKKYLIGLKDNGLKSLVDQGVLVQPIELILYETVMPWLIERMGAYIQDDQDIFNTRESVIDDAFKLGQV